MGIYEWLDRTIVPWFTSLGLTKRTVTLEVLGRKSGKPRRVPVAITQVGGARYLVSVHGESNWVRNIRAAKGQAVIVSGSRKPVMLVEIPLTERPPVLQAYVSQGSFGRSAADIAKGFGVEPDPSLDQMVPLAGRHPVFRIEDLP